MRDLLGTTVRGPLHMVQDAWERLAAEYRVPVFSCTVNDVSLCFCSRVVGCNICIVYSVLVAMICPLSLR